MLMHKMAKMIFEQASRRYYIWMWESLKFNYLDSMLFCGRFRSIGHLFGPNIDEMCKNMSCLLLS